MKLNNLKQWMPEIIIFILALCAYLLCSYYHEPWFDELYAWFLVRENSLKDLLFVIPHYEGHIPFWHLLLYPFVRLNCDILITLKSIGLVFYMASMYLILFKSPFPRWIRLCLPFTYFLFYPGAVIVRPYCIAMFAFFLLAYLYPKRNENPYKYLATLVLLSVTTPYGLIFAAGIAIVWLFDGFEFRNFKQSVLKIVRDKKFLMVSLFGVFCLLNVLNIIPLETEAMTQHVTGKMLDFRFLAVFFVIPGDLFFNSVFTSYYERIESVISILSTDLVRVILLACIFYLAYGFIAIKGKVKMLAFFPLMLCFLFGSLVYIFPRHFQVVFCFIVFVAWCASYAKIDYDAIQNRVFKASMRAFLIVALLLNIFWAAKVTYNEIKYPYVMYMSIVDYIKKNDLTQYTLFPGGTGFMATPELNTYYQDWTAPIILFFDAKNFPLFWTPKGKIINQIRFTTPEEDRELLEYIKKQPMPDILFGEHKVTVDMIYGKDNAYVLINQIPYSAMYKHHRSEYWFPVYVRRDICKEFFKKHPDAINREEVFFMDWDECAPKD